MAPKSLSDSSPEMTTLSPKPEPDPTAASSHVHETESIISASSAITRDVSNTADKEKSQIFISQYAGDEESQITNLADVPHRIGVPDGGLRAWLVVLGGFLDFTIAFGLLNSFGTFQAEYQQKWPTSSTSRITWIGSVQLFVLFAGGILVGPAFDRFGARPLMLSGTFFCLLSFIFASIASEYKHYLLSQGFLFGIGNALLFYPATGAISEWFDHRRGLALGIAVSGASFGGIFWPILVTRLYNTYTDEWVQRILAAISIPLLLVSCYLVKERKGVAGHDTAGKEAKPAQRSLTMAICDWHFLSLCLALLFIYCGMLVPFYYIPLYAEDVGHYSSEIANNLLAIGYSGSFFGRIGSGWLADRFGRFNVLILMGTLTSVVTFCWVRMTSLGAMIVFAILFGFFSGGLVPLGSACVAQTTPDMGHIGLRIGAMMAICSIGALAGGPISGVIKDHGDNWMGAFGFSAAMTLFGAALLLGLRLKSESYRVPF